ncbi:flavin reductase family protein [Agromyces sp. H66]|uniref:flavin reductase family protein n=1 Tax=Agromyces sp. H66 TaxID=2529859 RepID=UPI0010AA42EE|nr:flavin reductase family protein [Agromyces sp. H66]
MTELDLTLSPEHPTPADVTASGDRRHGASVADVDLRRLMRAIAQPVAVLTGRDVHGAPWGMTVSSFTCVSLDPPLVAVSVARRSRAWSSIAPTGRFVLSALAVGQETVAERFAAPSTAFPSAHASRFTVDGMPVVDGGVGAARCSIRDVHPGGDHDVVIARVERVRLGGDGRSLAYTRGGYASVDNLEEEPCPR